MAGLIKSSVIALIQERLSVSAVVSQKVKLKRAGRELRGLSPFNAEKTPSFYVNDAKGFYHCFSSGRHGTIFDFVMETEGLTFPEAVEKLAAMAGVEVVRERATREAEEARARRATARDALAAAQLFFRKSIKGNKAALEYLAGRGISRETIDAFGIGWAPPGRYELRDYLANMGFDLATMEDAGLIVSGHDIAVPYSFYRGRITIPITDRQGRIVSFGARGINGEEPKYLNGRETALFDKGMNLFNLSRAAAAISREGKAVVMEGYLDVIASAQAGIENVVAPLGTALTPGQMQALWRVAPSIVVCLDGDKAGIKAGDRTLTTALPWVSGDRRMVFASLPAGQDPDDVIRNNGVHVLRSVLDNPQTFGDRIWEALRRETPGDAPEDRAKVEKAASDLLEPIADAKMKRAFLDAMLSRARLIGRPARRQEAAVVVQRRTDNGIPAREAALVYAALLHPSYVEDDIEGFAALEMQAPVTQRLRDLVISTVSSGKAVDVDALAREVAILKETIPNPPPSFVTADNVKGFRSAVEIHTTQAARRRLKGRK